MDRVLGNLPTRWKWLIAVLVMVVASVQLGLALWPDQRATYAERLLLHFDLNPKHYVAVEGLELLPLRYAEVDALSFGEVQWYWYSTIMQPGYYQPVFFENKRGGLFVVTERPDGTLVGAHWYAVGGRTVFTMRRGDDGPFCGLCLRRVGATWSMGAPVYIEPLSP
jgi:hypothetical protein